MKKENKSKDTIFPIEENGAISYGKIKDIATSFAENDIQNDYTLDPLSNDATHKRLVSVESTLTNQRVDKEKDQKIMETLENMLSIDERHLINLNDYLRQTIRVLLESTAFAYRTFTLTNGIEASVTLSMDIMHVINAIALAIINEIEYVNPISIEAQATDYGIMLSYKAYVEMSDNLGSDEIEALYPSISVRKSYLDAICREYCLENSFKISEKQIELTYQLPTDTSEVAVLSSDPFSKETKEAILYYLDMFTY